MYKCSICNAVLEMIIIPKKDIPYTVVLIGGVALAIIIGTVYVVMRKRKTK